MAETVGSIIDKMNVIQLKIYHNTELTNTRGIDAGKKAALNQKLKVLDELLADLSTELNQLVDDIRYGRKKLKVYRQFKMYGQKKP